MKLTTILVWASGVIASLWLGFMLTAILHALVPLSRAGSMWMLNSACIWALSAGRALLQGSDSRDEPCLSETDGKGGR